MSDINYKAILPEGWPRAKGYSYGVVAKGATQIRLREQLRPLEHSHFVELCALGTFDALVATVLLVQQSTLTGSAELREWALDCYDYLQPVVADMPELCEVYPELFNLIDSACPHWVHVSPTLRLNLHMFWHQQAKNTWAKDRMAHIEQRLGLNERPSGYGEE